MAGNEQSYLDNYDRVSRELYASAVSGNTHKLPILRAQLKQAQEEAVKAIKRMQDE